LGASQTSGSAGAPSSSAPRAHRAQRCAAWLVRRAVAQSCVPPSTAWCPPAEPRCTITCLGLADTAPRAMPGWSGSRGEAPNTLPSPTFCEPDEKSQRTTSRRHAWSACLGHMWAGAGEGVRPVARSPPVKKKGGGAQRPTTYVPYDLFRRAGSETSPPQAGAVSQRPRSARCRRHFLPRHNGLTTSNMRVPSPLPPGKDSHERPY
jgi:hypothetical protein